MNMKHCMIRMAIACSMVIGTAVQAQDGAALYSSKACIACHGIDAKTSTTDAIPKLAGQNKTYLVQQMKDFKSGARNNGQAAQMTGIIGNVSDEEIEALAEYLSGL